jgi:uncharacterized protein (DUF433 family)
VERLEARADRTGESGNRLAARLLDEALRRDEHPLVYFRRGAAGARHPALIGTRLDVSDVVETVRASEGSVPDAADYLGVPERSVHACLAYYADYRDDVDAEIARRDAHAREARARWERTQEVLGEAPPG